MSSKLYYLLEELQKKNSPKLLSSVMDFLDNDFEVSDLLLDDEKSRKVLNGQSNYFYKALAASFVDCLEEFPQNYLLHWSTILSYFDVETLSNFYNLSKIVSNNSDATDYVNGLIELDNGNAQIALYHFNRINDFISCYFIAECYSQIENHENAIKNYNLFLSYWEDFRDKILETSKVDFLDNNNYVIVKWNVHSDLGYLYNRISEFENAKVHFDKSLELVEMELNYTVNFNQDNKSDNFTIFINNYLWSLEKLGKYKRCIEILDFVISKYPNNSFYNSQKIKFLEKLDRHSFADGIISNLLKVKKPFNINSFQETKIISREKILEDMIVEQIKYGFNVFGKKLEIYQDKKIFGRQYYIQSVNGILDLLLIDKTTNILYVVELKRDKAGIEVVQQIENYINGLTLQLKREVKGIISLHNPDRKLIELIKTKPNIELYTYEFQFKNVE